MTTSVREGAFRAGFSLVEMFAAIAIVGILAALLLPALQAGRESVRRTQCANNLRQIGIGMHGHLSAFGTFPPGQRQVMVGQKTWGWPVFLLEWMERSREFQQLELRKPIWGPENRAGVSAEIGEYLCPSTSRRQTTRHRHRISLDLINPDQWDAGTGEDMACIDYAGISGPTVHASLPHPATGEPYEANGGVLLNVSAGLATQTSASDIVDGLAQTLLVGELSGRGVFVSGSSNALRGVWAGGQNCVTVPAAPIGRRFVRPVNPAPADAWLNAGNSSLFSDHPYGAQVLFCDGAVRFLAETVQAQVVLALASRRDGEMIAE